MDPISKVGSKHVMKRKIAIEETVKLKVCFLQLLLITSVTLASWSVLMWADLNTQDTGKRGFRFIMLKAEAVLAVQLKCSIRLCALHS